MQTVQTLINTIALLFSLSTASSVALHDTHIDKALVKAIVAHPEINATINSVPHTHSERGSLYQAIRDINSSQPRTQPRNQEDRRYTQPKPGAGGHHPFDNASLPVVQ